MEASMIRKASLAVSALAIAGILSLQPTGAAAQQERVRCQSDDYDRTYCQADTRGGVRLVRQLSEADCVSGRTWGYDRRGIWVARGCRADFEVATRYSRDDRDRNGRDWDRDGDRDWDRDRDGDRGRDVVRAARARRNIAERQQAERICRDAVRDRVRNRSGSIRVDYTSQTRDGSRLVRWATNRSSGTCRISRNDRLVGFNYNR
jgi:hypothetical protein